MSLSPVLSSVMSQALAARLDVRAALAFQREIIQAEDRLADLTRLVKLHTDTAALHRLNGLDALAMHADHAAGNARVMADREAGRLADLKAAQAAELAKLERQVPR